MNPLGSLADYEWFVYSLRDAYPSVRVSTLRVERRGAALARIVGEPRFAAGLRLTVRERIVCDRIPARIDDYAYEIWRDSDKRCWYDAQPHPTDASVRSTFPHHKHVAPDMKHNRVPAPNLGFDQPNLPVLIAEVESLLAAR